MALSSDSDLLPQWTCTTRIKTPPICHPVSLSDVKTFARLDSIDEDHLIDMFIDAATIGAEEYLGRALIQQTRELKMDFWTGVSAFPQHFETSATVLPIPRPPLVDIVSVKTLYEDDTVAENWPLTSFYWNKGDKAELIIRRGSVPPINTERYFGGFLIEYIAGYSNADFDILTDKDALRNAIPMSIRIGIMLWASILYSQRGSIGVDDPPLEAEKWLSPHKVIRI